MLRRHGLIFYFLCLAALFGLAKIYLFDTFLVEQYSMNNTLFEGDKILVFKPGKPARQGIFVVDYGGTAFIKRCIGLPGDTLQILKGQVFINHQKMDFPATVITGSAAFPKADEKDQPAFDIEISNYYNAFWTRNDFGPLVIPRKGDRILIDSVNKRVYGELLKSESSGSSGSKLGSFYSFKKDYYFFMGDNRMVSDDSRIFGPVPCERIIGKALCVLYSGSKRGAFLKKIE